MKLKLENNDIVKILAGWYDNTAYLEYGKMINGKETIHDRHCDNVYLEDLLCLFGYDSKFSIDELYQSMHNLEAYINIHKNQEGKIKYSFCDVGTSEEIYSAGTLNELIQQILIHEDELNV